MPTNWATLDALGEQIGELVSRHDRAKSLAHFTRYADDPVGFIRRELKGAPWARQEEIARQVLAERKVVVRSCNGAGKDWLAALLALWWVYARRGLVLILGPTERQVREIVMGEVRRAFTRAGHLPGELYELALRLEGDELMGIRAFTSTDPSKLTGFHAPRLMVILTEAQGVEAYVWEGALANATGADSRILAVGNPLEPAGKFYETCRSAGWASLKIAAAEHPNVVQGAEVIPGAVTRDFIAQMASEYGEGSGVYAARVLAEFPSQADDTLVDREWVRASNSRWREAEGNGGAAGQVLLALDPARFGADATVLVVRRGRRLERLEAWQKASTMDTTARTLQALDTFGPRERGPRVVVDEPGLGGGIIDRLRELRVSVSPFNGGATPRRHPDKFRNARAEAFWHVRRQLEEGLIDLPPDEKLADELCAIRWKEGSDGKVELEPKDELRARLGRSPDRADAVALAFAEDLRPHLFVA